MVDIGGLVLCAPQQDSDFAPVHEDEALVLMRDICAHATANNAVPSWQVHSIEFCLDDLGDVVEDAALLECETDAINGVLLHVGVHVCMLHYSISCLLLINATVRLYHLRVSLPCPFLGLNGSCVRCYLRH